MTSINYLTFRKFSDEAAAVEFASLLKEQGIDLVFENTSASFDPGFSHNPLDKEYRIKLRQEDFDKAESLLQELYEQQLDSIGRDHYLFEFSDIELYEIIARPDEWGPLDYVLAKKILKDRGIRITPTEAEDLKQERLRKLAEPEKKQTLWITLGYIFSALGGLLGIFIGWHLRTHKKTLPNGERAFAYLPSDREHGLNIFILGLVALVAWIVVGSL